MRNRLREIADLALFAFVVEFGGISKCAVQLGLQRTTVSRRIKRLECTLGVRLLDRATNSVTTTTAGRGCFERGVGILTAAEEARRSALNERGEHGEPAGSGIVLAAPAIVLGQHLRAAIDRFQQRFEPADIVPMISDRWDDGLAAKADLAVVIGEVVSSTVQTVKLADVAQVLVASPRYLQQQGTPATPADLAKHRCVVDASDEARQSWLFRGEPASVSLDADRWQVVPDLLGAREAARAGLGIARLPAFVCAELAASEQLVPVLTEYELLSCPLSLVMPQRSVFRRDVVALKDQITAVFDTGPADLRQLEISSRVRRPSPPHGVSH
ncbi:MAG: LysR family transcriptional regulator [Pseudomonadota bacterium]